MDKRTIRRKKIQLFLKDTLEQKMWSSNEMKFILNRLLETEPTIAQNIGIEIKSTPVSEFELLKLGFEEFRDDYGFVNFRKFSFTITKFSNGDFMYGWIGGNTKIKSMEHLNLIYFCLTGDSIFE